MDFDIDQTVTDVVNALKGNLEQGWDTISSFATQQAKLLATQAQMIAQSRLDGSLRGDDALFQSFLDGLKATAENFVRTLTALTVLTIEKAWNAVVGVIWGALAKALSAVLPLPVMPLIGA